MRLIKSEMPDEDASTMQWALAYAALGWHVFPVEGKRPMPGSNGWHDATVDEARIRRWDWRNRGIGVAAHRSGLIVVDIDKKTAERDGADANGWEWVSAVTGLGREIPRDIEADTPSGGTHIIMRQPVGLSVHMVAGRGFPSVDILGNGYFVAAPSKNAGSRYEWVDGASPWDADVPAMPSWLINEIKARQKQVGQTLAPRVSGASVDVSGDDELTGNSDEIAAVESALALLSPDMPRTPWLEIGMALHSKSAGSSSGLELWREWSAKSPKYDAYDLEHDWRSFKVGGGIGIGTLFALAKLQGWEAEKWEAEAAERQLEASVGAARDADPDWGELYAEAVERLSERGPESAEPKPEPFETGFDLLQEVFPPTPWIVRGLLTDDAVFCVGGAPKASKTWAGLEILASILTGAPCFDELEVTPDPLRPVCAFFAEDGRRSVKNRLRALCASKVGGGQEWARRFFFKSKKALDLTSLESTAALLADVWSADRAGPSVLYLDPLRDLHTGEENDSGEMAVVMGRLRALQSILGCSVIFIHHTNKTEGSGRKAVNLRGSSVVHGAVDGGLYLHDVDKPGADRFVNKCEVELKSARGAGNFVLTLGLTDDEGGEAVDMCWDFSRPVKNNKNRQDHWETEIGHMRAAGDNQKRTVRQWAEAMEVSKSAAGRRLEAGTLKGQFYVDDSLRYALNLRWVE